MPNGCTAGHVSHLPGASLYDLTHPQYLAILQLIQNTIPTLPRRLWGGKADQTPDNHSWLNIAEKYGASARKKGLIPGWTFIARSLSWEAEVSV